MPINDLIALLQYAKNRQSEFTDYSEPYQYWGRVCDALKADLDHKCENELHKAETCQT